MAVPSQHQITHVRGTVSTALAGVCTVSEQSEGCELLPRLTQISPSLGEAQLLSESDSTARAGAVHRCEPRRMVVKCRTREMPSKLTGFLRLCRGRVLDLLERHTSRGYRIESTMSFGKRQRSPSHLLRRTTTANQSFLDVSESLPPCGHSHEHNMNPVVSTSPVRLIPVQRSRLVIIDDSEKVNKAIHRSDVIAVPNHGE